MADNQSDDEYPSWRKALTGNGHAANIYCAVKYGLWHLSHGLLAVALLPVLSIIKLWNKLTGLSDYIPETNVGVREKLTGPRSKKVSRYLSSAFMVLVFGSFVVWIVFMAIYQPVALGLGVGFAVGVVAVASVVVWLLDNGLYEYLASKSATVSEKAGTVKKKSEGTPLARRLLGYCPVSMDINPRWFDNFEDRIFGDE